MFTVYLYTVYLYHIHLVKLNCQSKFYDLKERPIVNSTYIISPYLYHRKYFHCHHNIESSFSHFEPIIFFLSFPAAVLLQSLGVSPTCCWPAPLAPTSPSAPLAPTSPPAPPVPPAPPATPAPPDPPDPHAPPTPPASPSPPTPPAPPASPSPPAPPVSLDTPATAVSRVSSTST